MPGIIVNIIWTAPGCPLEALCSLVQPRSLSGESRGSPGKPLWTCKSIEGITSPWTRSESAPPIGSINCRQSLILQARTINNQAIYAVLVGAVGIEPTTFGLKGRCSTTELRPWIDTIKRGLRDFANAGLRLLASSL